MNKTNQAANDISSMSNRHEPAAVRAENSQPSIENILQALVENSFDLAGLIDEKFNYRFVTDSVNQIFNKKADALFGVAAEQLLGKNCLERVHPDDQQRLAEQLSSLLENEKKVHLLPYRINDAYGNWHWLEAIVTNQLANPTIQAIVVSAREVTQQVETEQKLKEMLLLEALREGEEKERSRIARDLHDEISGMIAAAKMQFSSLLAHVPQIADTTGYQQGIQLLENAALQVRRTSHNLMPEILLENGLSEALRRYCRNVSSDSLLIDFISIGENRRFSPTFELSLYRIAQEFISNILKHSHATTALVQISVHDNMLSLVIEDNGKGFSTDAEKNGTGLASIRRRVEAMKGTLDISSGNGVQVYLEFEM
ncbi:MAG TPA: PAS domain-containing sensor histidine kinase [Flavisolibacter sp.]|nr:PAS domain-containing sensor histidine kinase [Flavisolibacter sp.]